MTPTKTLIQIQSFIETLVGLSLSNEQNFPATHGNARGTFEITVNNAAEMSVALRNVAYREIFHELEKARCFNLKMLDGALISFRYRFLREAISEHSLCYFPSPDLEHFQNEPDIYMDDEVYADIIARNIVAFPVRFDFNSSPERFVDVHHPYSHLTLGQYENCRIPVCSPIGPLAFGGFILRSFYNTAYQKYSDRIPASASFFENTITENERKILHLVCGE
ncbi:MAG: DUF2290 domain-containing protein [Planctomyces sp.]|nr:DUF2290 domain-containing protein [Planctomyces sp.]